MSHWNTFKNQNSALENTNMDLLHKAIAEMGVQLDTSIKEITNPWGKEAVDMGLKRDGRALALGFRRVQVNGKTTLELRGDFYSTGLREDTFIDRLSQIYTKEDIINRIQHNSSYMIESQTYNEKTGEYEIIAYQYA